ncbi:histone-lysine N-methyltransferase ASHR3 isoform X2 [Aristolochia californica]|uniref:histone-lysine N-methyltransferase ASHR3 isoform X2 n=1 Tax=Aristolochia californica TaxID=171875 RepID=UPI0035D885D1
MPALSNLLDSSSLALIPYTDPLSDPCGSNAFPHEIVGATETSGELNGFCCIWDSRLRYPFLTKDESCLAKKERPVIGALGKNKRRLSRYAGLEKKKKAASLMSLEDHVKMWVKKKVASGVPEKECCLPFLTNAPKAVECRLCSKIIYTGEEILCSVRGCEEAFHKTCAMSTPGVSSSKRFTCPVHACFACKKKGYYWRCMRCTISAHRRCEAWPDNVIHPTGQPRKAVCWMHHADWRLEKKHAVATSDAEEIFSRLPLPYFDQEFDIDFLHMDILKNDLEPTPYIHIRRNIYLVKKKRSDTDADAGCTNCKDKICFEDCVCRVQSISCSKVCNCSEMCTNRPFRKEKRIKVVKTQSCGWGVVAAESIKKGEFVIEYLGEVIDDALCEQRLWDMKYKGAKKFYMCEIRKDFTIDATFKGNSSRFLNHSCDPNCKLEKWQVDEETRLGVFASRSIEAGESLTYDYRFVHFGPMVRCCCGAKNCQGYLGSKKKQDIMNLCWGKKRQRSTAYVIPF